MTRQLVLVKHAMPVIDTEVPPAQWQLGLEGEGQVLALAERLRRFVPFRLVSSPEPKALRTCEIVADALGTRMACVRELREFDRPALPWMSADEHARVNAEIFQTRDRPVLGRDFR